MSPSEDTGDNRILDKLQSRHAKHSLLLMRRRTTRKQRRAAAVSPWQSALVVAVVTAILASGLNWMLWVVNRRSMLDEKLIDRRLDILSDTAGAVSVGQESRWWQAVTAATVLSETQGHEPVSLEEKAQIESRLKRLMPYEWERADKAREFGAEFDKQLLLAQLYFGPKTKEAILRLQGVRGKSIDAVIRGYAQANRAAVTPNHSGVRVNFRTSEIAAFATAEFVTASEDVLNAMREELASPSTIW